MEQRIISNTALRVSPLCLGTMTFGTPVAEKDAVRIVHWALDHGVNFIDTANMYEGYDRYVGSPGGVAEEILGTALKGRRDRAVVATKVGMSVGPGPDDAGLGRTHVLRECERSLQRLDTDWIDIYYMHTPDPNTPLRQSIAVFAELVGAGKVRHWGLSNFDPREVDQVLRICDENGHPRPVVHEPAYSLLKRDIEQDLLPLCRREDIAVVPYQVLQGGLLTGKYSDPSAPPEGTRASEKPGWIPLLNDQNALSAVEKISDLAREAGVSLYDYVIRTTVDTPGITSIILGVTRPEQLGQAIAALETSEHA